MSCCGTKEEDCDDCASRSRSPGAWLRRAGAGTGSYRFEAASGIYTELQCGSYVFMDADFGRVRDEADRPISEFENALFVWTQVMSHVKADRAVCEAGLKVLSVDPGLPAVHWEGALEYVGACDGHGVISGPSGALKLGDKLKRVPGRCDPTCNLHNRYAGVRGAKVECLWPVTARGLSL